MLRFNRRITTAGGANGTPLTVSHGLYNQAVALGNTPPAAPECWAITSYGAARGAGRWHVTAVGTNRITIRNTAGSSCTADIWCWAFEGRRY